MEILLSEFQHQEDFPFFVQYGHHEDQMPFHRHADFNELVFVLGGSALHRVNAEVYPIVKGDIFVITGTTAHGFEEARELRLFNVLYRDSVLGDMVTRLRQLAGYQALFVVEPLLRQGSRFESRLRIGGDRQHAVEQTLAALEAEHAEKAPGWTLAVVATFLDLIVRVSRWYQEAPSEGWSHPLPLARGFAKLEAPQPVPLRMADIAAEAGVSERHFRRLFQQSYGLSPHRFLQTQRVHRACELLVHTTLPLAEVALRCGFCDQGHMSRHLRRLTGQSPTQWRAWKGPG